jgi:hypothetical protein
MKLASAILAKHKPQTNHLYSKSIALFTSIFTTLLRLPPRFLDYYDPNTTTPFLPLHNDSSLPPHPSPRLANFARISPYPPQPGTSYAHLLDPDTRSPRCFILIQRTWDLSFLLVSRQVHFEAPRMFYLRAVQTLLSTCAVRIYFHMII